MDDDVTARRLNEAESDALHAEAGRFPKLRHVGEGRWTLAFRPGRDRVARIGGSLPSVLWIAGKLIRMSWSRRQGHG